MQIEFEMRLAAETDKAYCFTEDIKKNNVLQVYWIPKSVISEVKRTKNEQYYFEVPEWLAQEKGLI